MGTEAAVLVALGDQQTPGAIFGCVLIALGRWRRRLLVAAGYKKARGFFFLFHNDIILENGQQAAAANGPSAIPAPVLPAAFHSFSS